MADRVHAAMDQMGAPALQPVIDRPRSNSARHELPPSHHTMLPLGKHRDQLVDQTSAQFTP